MFWTAILSRRVSPVGVEIDGIVEGVAMVDESSVKMESFRAQYENAVKKHLGFKTC